MTSATDALYHALIVEHDRSPRNEGALANATHTATIDNPLCGDIVTIRVIVEETTGDGPRLSGVLETGDGPRLSGARIVDAKFEARGCALCRAAASMMTTRVFGARVDEVDALVARFERFVAGVGVDAKGAGIEAKGDDSALGDLVAFRGVQAVRSRRTCATLPFRALAAALLER